MRTATLLRLGKPDYMIGFAVDLTLVRTFLFEGNFCFSLKAEDQAT
jgi:hypothetical protein